MCDCADVALPQTVADLITFTLGNLVAAGRFLQWLMCGVVDMRSVAAK